MAEKCQSRPPLALEMNHSEVSGVILLLGPPGAGKSLLGQSLENNSGGRVFFVNVGEQLRADGLVGGDKGCPTEKERLEIDRKARDVIENACTALISENSAPAACISEGKTAKAILVLEAVKDIHNAYLLMEILETKDVHLLHVLLLSGRAVASAMLKQQRRLGSPEVSDLEGVRQRRDDERLVKERQTKWNLNAGLLIEFFSSMGLLSEVGLAEVPGQTQDGQLRRRCGIAKKIQLTKESSLLSHGYGLTGGLGFAALGLKLPEGITSTLIEPVTSQRLVTNHVFREVILNQAEKSSGLQNLNLPAATSGIPVPSRIIHDISDIRWISGEGRYYVTRKCDGTRHLLIIAHDAAAYFLNRAGSLYAYPIKLGARGNLEPKGCGEGAESLPPGTILDGELLWMNGKGFYLAFDCIALGSDKTWQQHFSNRLQCLSTVLAEAESCAILSTAASASSSPMVQLELNKQGQISSVGMSPMSQGSTQRVQSNVHSRVFHLEKKQQAAPLGSDTVTVLRKGHFLLSVENIAKLNATSMECPYPTDGLVFTPCSMPYALGMAELLFKWQPKHMIALDLAPQHELLRLDATNCLPWLIYECRRQHENKPVENWRPVSIRWDKVRPNADISTIDRRQSYPCNGSLLKAFQMVDQVGIDTSLSDVSDFCHPARALPFDILYTNVLQAVRENRIERTIDAETGLEIFNSKRSNITAAQPNYDEDEPEIFCRGLVVHAASRTIVATPFVQFRQTGLENVSDIADDDLEGIRCSASLKLDGTLVIAFEWDKEVRVATRRRMDSEQAKWALKWLNTNARLERFEPGWTYLFEAIYKQNTVIISYPFEGLVLLGAVAPTGSMLRYSDMLAVATAIGVMAAPRISGLVTEIRRNLRDLRQSPSSCTFEGWVLRVPGESSLWKLVHPAYKTSSMKVKLLHPVAIWDRIRCGGENRRRLAEDFPKHLLSDLSRMVEALETAYRGIRRLLEIMFLQAKERHGELQRFIEILSQIAGLPDAVGNSSFAEFNRTLRWLKPPAPLHPSIPISTKLVASLSSSDSELQRILQRMSLQDSTAADAGWSEVASLSSSETELQRILQGISLQYSTAGDAGQSEKGLAHRDVNKILLLLHEEDPQGLWRQHLQMHSMCTLDIPQETYLINRGVNDVTSEIQIVRDAFLFALAEVAQKSSPRFLMALNHVLQLKGPGLSASSEHMFYDATDEHEGFWSEKTYKSAPTCRLRTLILDCVEPGIDGDLPGYTPSPNLQQTCAKGWLGGPKVGKFVTKPMISAFLDESLLGLVLQQLEGREMMNASLVCKQWALIIKEDTGHSTKAFQLQSARPKFSYRFESSDDWSGYGSYGNSGNDYFYGYQGYGSP